MEFWNDLVQTSDGIGKDPRGQKMYTSRGLNNSLSMKYLKHNVETSV